MHVVVKASRDIVSSYRNGFQYLRDACLVDHPPFFCRVWRDQRPTLGRTSQDQCISGRSMVAKTNSNISRSCEIIQEEFS